MSSHLPEVAVGLEGLLHVGEGRVLGQILAKQRLAAVEAPRLLVALLQVALDPTDMGRDLVQTAQVRELVQALHLL